VVEDVVIEGLDVLAAVIGAEQPEQTVFRVNERVAQLPQK
jgi:hypothetical protein